MNMIDKDRVLRLNCPGFGEETHLNMGRAKTLENYQVIITNPVSLLHLFDKGPEPTRRINQLLSEGVNQLNVPDDALIQELINESDARLEELIPFLSQGGLLIYFLCRPFVLAGPTISVDNYDWLSVYAPAMKNPPENGSRQMSSVSHGRIIEPTEEGEQSEFAEYLTQQGVEWNTIIRTDFLSSNYSVMATAGSKKCIAAQFWAGDNGGKVVFLPAPYSPDFDRVLMNCVDKWYQEAVRQGTIQPSSPVSVPVGAEDMGIRKPTGPDFYNGEQVETPPTLNELGIPTNAQPTAPAAPASAPAAQTFAPPPLSSLLKMSDDAPAADAQKAQPPKGALKSLLAADFDDDDDLDSAPPAPPAVKITAQDILESVSKEAGKASPAAALADSEPVDAERPKVVEPEKAQVSNFELKKATAEMDLSQFAQTARQLVEQANVIESVTRDPAKEAPKEAPKPTVPAPPPVPIPANAAKQRIADLLKGLEFGKDQKDSDDLEPPAPTPSGEDTVDVESAPAAKPSTLAGGLRPNRESVSRNWLGGGSNNQAAADDAEMAPIDVAPLSPSAPTPAPAAAQTAGGITGMTTDEFRSTFEFLKGDDDSPHDEALMAKPSFKVEDVPEEKLSLMQQAGLSADSLMNELNVMNELNALMEESEREAKAAAQTKEESPLQSLFKGEAQDEGKEESEEKEREKSLQALMESLGQHEAAAASPTREPAAPGAPPAPILQTASSLMEELSNAAARFDETKTAESAPSLKLAHEELITPSPAPAPAMPQAAGASFDDDEEEFSWAPKIPTAPTMSSSVNPAPAVAESAAEVKPAPTPTSSPRAAMAALSGLNDLDDLDFEDLSSAPEHEKAVEAPSAASAPAPAANDESLGSGTFSVLDLPLAAKAAPEPEPAAEPPSAPQPVEASTPPSPVEPAAVQAPAPAEAPAVESPAAAVPAAEPAPAAAPAAQPASTYSAWAPAA
ncbi:MAG: hypothetical protein JSS83_25295, partial [Cyanobacteria bacterium SZAS LIN-3]|nr:hypothetical protein [Cyanobacteria bacterium SZAS LIN-3]